MISKLTAIAQQKDRLILGLMSGTSLDGLDIALCKIRGNGRETDLRVLQFKTVTYTDQIRNDIKDIFSKTTVDMAKLSGMHALIGTLFAECVLLALEEWNMEPSMIDLIASHGQTIYHAPKSLTKSNYPNSTFQIGDGDHIAVKTGIITVSDFRQKHIAAGGEGAPLVAYGDQMLFSHDIKDRFLLNIGGIANFTYLPAYTDRNAALLSTDTGPGNTLMNQYMQIHLNEPFDDGGKFAATGAVHPQLLELLLDDPFFQLPLPKTTGPELFNLDYLNNAIQKAGIQAMKHPDVMATLCAFTAKSIAQTMQKVKGDGLHKEVYVSGGGIYNHHLIDTLKTMLPEDNIYAFDALGLPGDAKEAALFALLANETVAGNANNMNGGSGAPHVCLGKISLPH